LLVSLIGHVFGKDALVQLCNRFSFFLKLRGFVREVDFFDRINKLPTAIIMTAFYYDVFGLSAALLRK